MSINIKKYTKDQMAKMVKEAQCAQKEAEDTAEKYFEWAKKLREQISKMETQERALRAKNAALTEQLDQMNGEAINRANEIANLKADADVLRNKLDDTEAALGRANADAAQQTSFAEYHKREYDAMTERYKTAALEEWRAKNHPWRNLWAWAKRKLGCD